MFERKSPFLTSVAEVLTDYSFLPLKEEARPASLFVLPAFLCLSAEATLSTQ
jgi:hypothetical protein